MKFKTITMSPHEPLRCLSEDFSMRIAAATERKIRDEMMRQRIHRLDAIVELGPLEFHSDDWHKPYNGTCYWVHVSRTITVRRKLLPGPRPLP